MKKFSALFMSFVFVVTLSACEGGAGKTTMEQPSLNSSFSCNAEIACGETEATATITRLGKSAWDTEFQSPKTLAGVKLSLLDDEMTASYKGLSFSVPKSALPLKSVIVNFSEAIDAQAEKASLEGKAKDGIITVEGECTGGEYKLKLDEATGGLTGFEMPAYELTIVFTDFTPLSSVPSDTQQTTETTQAVTTTAIQEKTVQ